MRIDTSLQANITMVCGSSGSGKSAWVKQQISGAPRLLVWDIDDEYSGPGIQRVTSLSQLARLLRTQATGRYAYVGNIGDFSGWCKAAFAWGHCTVVAEELASVTSPGKAPPDWHVLVSRGRKRGITLYGVTQRPAESDKTIIGNASVIHVGRMTRAQDRDYMAREMDVPLQDLAALQNLEWLERDMKTMQVRRGKLDFSSKKPVNGKARKKG